MAGRLDLSNARGEASSQSRQKLKTTSLALPTALVPRARGRRTIIGVGIESFAQFAQDSTSRGGGFGNRMSGPGRVDGNIIDKDRENERPPRGRLEIAGQRLAGQHGFAIKVVGDIKRPGLGTRMAASGAIRGD